MGRRGVLETETAVPLPAVVGLAGGQLCSWAPRCAAVVPGAGTRTAHAGLTARQCGRR